MEVKQAVITGQNQVELEQFELDESLDAESLLIQTQWTFISAGTELANYTGREPKVFKPNQWCTYPWRPGYANVGVVRAVGDRVDKAATGDRVFTYGPHASAFKYDQNRLVAPVPEGMDPVIAAASRMAGVATTAVNVSRIQGNPWVLVLGLGPVGNLAAQSYRIQGCRVIGADPVAHKCELARTCGIEHTLGGEPDDVHQAVMELTDGRGADITVDAVGHSAVVAQAVHATADYGQIIILGTPRVPVTADLTPMLSDIHLRWLTVRGALEWCVPMYPTPGGGISQLSKQQMIFDWLNRGIMHIEPLISHRLSPLQIKQAYEGLENEPEVYTGVALDWN